MSRMVASEMFHKRIIRNADRRADPPLGAAITHEGTNVEWDHIEGPLRLVDPELLRFAESRDLIVTHSEDGWPSRLLYWTDFMRRQIYLYLDNHEKLTYTLCICATQDKDGCRYIKAMPVRESMKIEEMMYGLPQLLHSLYRELCSWSAADLEFAIKKP